MSALIEFSEIRLRSVHWANQACFLMKDKRIYAMTRNICFRMGLFFKYGKTTGKLAHDTTTYIIDNQKLLFESCQHNCFVLFWFLLSKKEFYSSTQVRRTLYHPVPGSVLNENTESSIELYVRHLKLNKKQEVC